MSKSMSITRRTNQYFMEGPYSDLGDPQANVFLTSNKLQSELIGEIIIEPGEDPYFFYEEHNKPDVEATFLPMSLTYSSDFAEAFRKVVDQLEEDAKKADTTVTNQVIQRFSDSADFY